MKFTLAQAKKTMTDTIIVSFFFNARGEDLEKSIIGMYRSLLVQLLEKAPELQSVLDCLGSILTSKNGSHRWDIEILKNIFRHAVEQLRQRRLTCFIDALDECEEDQIRDMVADFEHLAQLAFSTRVQFRVCFSSRHYPYITIEKGLQLILEGQNGHNEDIAKYLHSELKIGHSKPAEQVRIEIMEKASGIFMWENALNDLWSDYGATFPSLSHERLKQCCYNYMKINTSGHLPLSLPLPRASSTEAMNLRQMASEKLPLLKYAVCNVLYHADLAESGGVPQSAFLEHFPLGDWITLNNLIEKFQIRRYTTSASLLYILAEGNLPDLIRIQLRRVSNMDIMGERYCFPIFAALANGNENVVRAFLLPDTDLQSDGDVPRAVSQDHQGLLKLIENIRDIEPRNRRTLLSYVAERGDVPLVRLMLATGRVEPDSKDKASRTPLSWTAEKGHEAVVKILLATGHVEPDSKDISGQTPLSRAVDKGHKAVVELLLATGRVEPNSKDDYGVTPLSRAARDDYEAVV